MSDWKVVEVDGGREWDKDSRADAEEAVEEFSDMGLEIVGPEGSVNETEDPEIVEGEKSVPRTEEPPAGGGQGFETKGRESGINALAENPIEWLNSKNTEYVNVIKGTDSISKRGFRYIQSQFGVSTQSEIIEVLDDPLGVIVWAKAELPDGRHAEAHGEGYRFEGGLDDNEFARYADTRAKNRALADLTASGALATEEMQGHD